MRRGEQKSEGVGDLSDESVRVLLEVVSEFGSHREEMLEFLLSARFGNELIIF
jgi:hypothetical protein